jgi:MFS family permease
MTARLVPIGLITLAFNLGGGLVAPALPLYARSLGADYRDLGLIGAAHGLAFAALTIPLGRASDRYGRRAILMLSGIGIGGAAALYLAAGHVAGLAAGKLLEAAAWAAFWPTLEAWVAERFGARAGAAMGVAYGAYALAFVVGTAVGGFVVEAFGLRAPFALYLGTAALAVVLVAALAGGEAAGAQAARHHAAATPRIVTTDPALSRTRRVLAYATGFVYVYGLGTVLAFLPVYGADRALSPRRVGLLLAAYGIARVFGSLGAGRVSDAVGRRTVLVPAMLVTAVGAGLVVAPLGPAALFLGAMALGLAAGASAPTCIALIADHVSAADRGVAMGLFEAACGVSILASGLLGGFAAEALGGEAPYLIVGALALAWAGILARALRPVRG